MSEPTEVKFWMVFTPNGSSLRYCHASRTSADNEAKRLATANPGQRFFVLKAMCGFEAEKPKEPVQVRMIFDPIPF